ncbi:unnamed protein product [Amoebophrya sp. A120]|nr:unnamed protein product [Amoebophrya sp. A120]|eukprot:GSA120T00005982001.1
MLLASTDLKRTSAGPRRAGGRDFFARISQRSRWAALAPVSGGSAAFSILKANPTAGRGRRARDDNNEPSRPPKGPRSGSY